jgi:glycosyltransferase involved in cell wall biosynthesis
MSRIFYDPGAFPDGFWGEEKPDFIARCLLRLRAEKPGLDCFFAGGIPSDSEAGQGPQQTFRITQKSPYPTNRKGPGWGFGFFRSGEKGPGADLRVLHAQAWRSRIPLPFAIWVPGPAFPEESARTKRQWEKPFHAASAIFTDSPYHRTKLIERFTLPEEKVVVLPGAADEDLTPLQGKEREAVKYLYASAKEYFWIDQPDLNPVQLEWLLKSFAYFKKKQRTNMQLVITRVSEKTMDRFAAKASTFLYREDLHFYPSLSGNQRAGLLGACYGWIQPFGVRSAVNILNTFQTRVPLLVADEPSHREIAGNACLYLTGSQYPQLGELMILLFKDENLRNQLLERGRLRLGEMGWEKNTELLWEGLRRSLQAV